MFSIPAIVALLTFIFVRPQEIFPVLAKIPFLYLLCGLCIFGLVIDLRLRLVKPIGTPLLLWAVLFVIWVVLSIALTSPTDLLQARLIAIGVSFLLFLSISQGIQTFRGLQVVTWVLAALALFLTLVAVHQGHAPLGCALIDEAEVENSTPDGRPCKTVVDCYGADAEPGGEYRCEHIGLFGTTSIELRVRYRGVLKDPNELAMAISCGLALIIAFVSRRRTFGWLVFAGLCTVAVMAALIETESRGGQLVFLGVLGTYFVKRLGWRGIAIGLLMAVPVLMLGGRGGQAASESSELRFAAWRDGIDMLTSHPLLGVGKDMFTEIHGITAHNSYVLAASELGFPGFVLWSILLYMSLKILWRGTRDFVDVPGAEVARAWALGLLAAMVGMAVGILFLSFTYHYVLWIYFGVCGAYYSAVKSHVPGWRVRFGLGDFGLVLAADVGFFLALHVALRLKGF